MKKSEKRDIVMKVHCHTLIREREQTEGTETDVIRAIGRLWRLRRQNSSGDDRAGGDVLSLNCRSKTGKIDTLVIIQLKNSEV